jgi:hypothetical protein
MTIGFGTESHEKAQKAQKELTDTRNLCASCAFFVAIALSLEISLTRIVSAVAIQLNGLAGAFARSATVFPVGLRRASARWIFAFLFVSHNSLPNNPD